MTHQLILAYGLYRKMEVYKPKPSSSQQIQQFHSEDYVDFLQKINPDNLKQYTAQMQKFNLGEYTDCPVSTVYTTFAPRTRDAPSTGR
jgi:histone deacetylase 1/2